ncbi:MAG: hypothetical protein U0Q11_11215 [Vicinamibacterales bacterium]
MMNWTSCGRTLCVSLLLASPVMCTGTALAQSASATTVDFDAAMSGLRFAPATLDANLDITNKSNGMLDADEMALVAAVLAAPSLNLAATSGVNSAAVRSAFEQARASARTDLKATRPLPTPLSMSRLATRCSARARSTPDSWQKMSAGFGAPLKGDYSRRAASSDTGVWHSTVTPTATVSAASSMNTRRPSRRDSGQPF